MNLNMVSIVVSTESASDSIVCILLILKVCYHCIVIQLSNELAVAAL